VEGGRERTWKVEEREKERGRNGKGMIVKEIVNRAERREAVCAGNGNEFNFLIKTT